MRRHGLIILAVGLLIAADAPQEERDRLEGTWKIGSLQINGRRANPGTRSLRLTVRADRIKTNIKGDKGVTFRLDPDKDPKAIDLTPIGKDLFGVIEVPDKGKTFKGIYALGKGELKICLDLFSKDRPAEFASKPNSGLVVLVLKSQGTRER